MIKDSAERTLASLRGSQGLRLLAVAILALLLLIPVGMISSLVAEREARRTAAIAEVSGKWGNAQSITGPALVLPYTHRWSESVADGKVLSRSETRHAIFLPEQLRIKGALDTDQRRRGIFSVPVYTLAISLEGEFERPNLRALGVDSAAVDWSRAHLAVGISDARAIKEGTSLTWNGQSVAFLPGTGGFDGATTGIQAPLGGSAMPQRIPFSFPLALNGSLQADVVPFGRTTSVELRGDHGHPSFQGNWLPAERTISADAFVARWSVSFLGRSYPQSWTSDSEVAQEIVNSRFGVALVNPVDHYHMAGRSVKYAGLFIFLTFATIWLIEILAGVRVHSIQYLMLGGALCLFYLLQLSLAEHIGFPFAYLLASLAVIAMVGFFSIVALKRRQRAAVVATGVALLYGYLYLLLMNEDYALLIGSIGLFLVLAAIMFVTRRVDWYAGRAAVNGEQ